MNQKIRTVYYIAACYFVISIALFSVFIYSYRYYFYKIQKITVINEEKTRQDAFLKNLISKFRSHEARIRAEKKSYQDTLRKAAKDELYVVKQALLHANDKKGENKIEPLLESEDDPGFIFKDDAFTEEKLKKILNPNKKSDFEKHFVELFNKLSSNKKSFIQIRRFSKGVLSDPVPISYIQFASTHLELQRGGHRFEWTLRAYGIPDLSKKFNLMDVIQELQRSERIKAEQLVVYAFGKPTPAFQGQYNGIPYEKVEHFSKEALKSADLLHKSFESEEMTFKDDQNTQKVSLLSVLVDPKLKLILASNNDIFEYRWKQFSFYDRNIVPILTYAVLAWFVCPLLVWFAYKMAARFRFNFTLDLDSDSPSPPPHSLTEPYPEPIQNNEEEDVAPLPLPQQDIEQEKVSIPSSEEKTEPKTQEKAKTQIKDLMPMFEQVDQQDIIDIRNNNIRKSEGSFNRNDNSEEDVDYLEGVQSDVLKSLIHKLRNS